MRIASITTAVFLLLVPCLAYGQTDEEVFEEFQFNFATPGARANAMGRAFIGLADDATAAQSNPAGLVILTKPEVSFEYKYTDYTVERAASYDSIETGRTTDFGESVSSPAFVSVVVPVGNARLAFYRQEYLNYKEDFQLGVRYIPSTGTTFNKSTADVDFRGVNWGGAVAYQFSSKFMIGFSGKLSQLKVDMLSKRYVNLTDVQSQTAIDDTDSKFSFTAGMLINPSRTFSLGAIYERNGGFEYTEDYVFYQSGGGTTTRTYPVEIKVPDRFGVGAAVRPTDALTILADVVYVQYSQISDNMTIVTFHNRGIRSSDFSIDNATEFHAGGEYVFFAGKTGIALRGGVFSNPNHSLTYVGETASIAGREADALFNFGDDDTEIGYTVGGGLVLSERFQVDGAYLHSDSFQEFSVSFVVRF